MRNTLKHSFWAVVALSLSGLFYACSQDDLTEATSTVTEDDFSVRVKNGYLEFKDQATFDEIKKSLEGADRETMDAWEDQFSGFTSLRSIEDRAEDAQEAWFQELRNMSEEDRSLLAQGNGDFWYSDYFKENASLFTLQDSGIYHLNVTEPSPDLLGYLNKELIYKVGNEIRVYQDNMLKTILDGDDKKIAMLKNINESSDELKINVTKYIILPYNDVQVANGRQDIYISSNINRRVCGHTNGKDRVTGEVYIAKTYYSTFNGAFYRYSLRYDLVNWYKDGLFGGYTRKRTSALKMLGNLSLSLDYSYVGGGSINVNTGGNLTARIRGEYPLYDDFVGNANPYFQVSGVLDVYGRNSTKCGDNPLDPSVPVGHDNRWK